MGTLQTILTSVAVLIILFEIYKIVIKKYGGSIEDYIEEDNWLNPKEWKLFEEVGDKATDWLLEKYPNKPLKYLDKAFDVLCDEVNPEAEKKLRKNKETAKAHIADKVIKEDENISLPDKLSKLL